MESPEVHVCGQCNMPKPRSQYVQNMWPRRHSRLTRCNECRLSTPYWEWARANRRDAKRATGNRSYHKRKVDVGQRHRNRKAMAPELAMIKSALGRSRKQGIPFSITPADIIIPAVCPVFGTKMKFNCRAHRQTSPSLDKVTPHLGYIPGNVRVISFKANAIKGRSNASELLRVAAYVAGATLEGRGQEMACRILALADLCDEMEVFFAMQKEWPGS